MWIGIAWIMWWAGCWLWAAGCDEEEGPGNGPGSDCGTEFRMTIGVDDHDPSWTERVYARVAKGDGNVLIKINAEEGDINWALTFASIENPDADSAGGFPAGEHGTMVCHADDDYGDSCDWGEDFKTIEFRYQTYREKTAGTFDAILNDANVTPVSGCWLDLPIMVSEE